MPQWRWSSSTIFSTEGHDQRGAKGKWGGKMTCLSVVQCCTWHDIVNLWRCVRCHPSFSCWNFALYTIVYIPRNIKVASNAIGVTSTMIEKKLCCLLNIHLFFLNTGVLNNQRWDSSIRALVDYCSAIISVPMFCMHSNPSMPLIHPACRVMVSDYRKWDCCKRDHRSLNTKYVYSQTLSNETTTGKYSSIVVLWGGINYLLKWQQSVIGMSLKPVLDIVLCTHDSFVFYMSDVLALSSLLCSISVVCLHFCCTLSPVMFKVHLIYHFYLICIEIVNNECENVYSDARPLFILDLLILVHAATVEYLWYSK